MPRSSRMSQWWWTISLNGGHTIRKYTDESNSTKKVELGERDVEPDEEDDLLFELEDIDEEEVILYLEDFYDSTNET